MTYGFLTTAPNSLSLLYNWKGEGCIVQNSTAMALSTVTNMSATALIGLQTWYALSTDRAKDMLNFDK
jgi:hypothetical protein